MVYKNMWSKPDLQKKIKLIISSPLLRYSPTFHIFLYAYNDLDWCSLLLKFLFLFEYIILATRELFLYLK
jgi:hypothetical protein